MSSVVSGRSSSTVLAPASLDRRFYAFVVDRAIAWGLDAVAVLVAWGVWFDQGHVWPGVLLVVGTLLLVGLAMAVLAGTRGTSPGKALLGLRLVDHESGTPIGVGRAMVRALVLGVGGLPTFGLGVATLAQTALMDPQRERRGWHDRITGSIVVAPQSSPPVEEIVVEQPQRIVNLTALRLAPVETPTAPPATPRPTRAKHAARTPPAVPPPAAAPAAPPPAPPPPPVRARWRVAFDTGESLVVEGLLLVGRRPEGRPGEPVRHAVNLASTDMSLSKTHAQLQVAPDGTLVVMDRGSTNGSTLVRAGVSRDLPARRPTSLLSGDEIHLGDRVAKVYRED